MRGTYRVASNHKLGLFDVVFGLSSIIRLIHGVIIYKSKLKNEHQTILFRWMRESGHG